MVRRYYLPRAYPDELIWSTLIRATRHRGLREQVSNLWSCLPGFAEALGSTPLGVLYRHTTFPYVTAFMSEQETARLAGLLVGNTSGIPTSLAQGPPMDGMGFLYCESCVQDDHHLYREAYWHRSHNLPFAQACNVHGLPLRFLCDASANALRWSLPAEGKSCRVHTHLSRGLADELHGLGEQLLNGQERLEPRAWAHRYSGALEAKGLPRYRHGLASASFLSAFRDFYGEPFLVAHGLKFALNGNAWPALILRASSTNCVAKKHVLVQAFLRTASDLQDAQCEYRPEPNFRAMDKQFASNLRKQLSKQKAFGPRMTVAKLLVASGIGKKFSRNRARLPVTAALVEEYKQRARQGRKNSYKS
jgi:hypothetical protein